MDDNEFAPAGWLAIAAAVLVLPLLVLGILVDLPKLSLTPLLVPYLLVATAQTTFALYALWRFRVLLNRRFDYHGIDLLVTLVVVGTLVMTAVALATKSATALGLIPRTIPFVVSAAAVFLSVAIPLAILGVVLSIRLLRFSEGMEGLIRPFAWVTLVACLLYGTIVLAPIGMLVDAASNVILGLIFLRPMPPPETPEFV